MDDAERDAWLREALRHAPDADAVPSTMISAAILAEARAAAAQPAGPALRRASAAPANPSLALWNWLARPPVAAGFASVMAATLVGLMWWDRPMDETVPRPPTLERSEAKRGTASVPLDAATTAAGPAAATAPTAPTAPAPPATVPLAPAQSPTTPARVAPAGEARRGDSANAERARAKDNPPAKERDALRKSDTPAAFPSTEGERASRAASRAMAQDAKKEADATPAPTTSPAPFAAAERSAPPPAAPMVAAPAPAPLQSGRLASEEPRLAASNRADVGAAAGATAKSAAPSGSLTAPARDSAAQPAAAPLASLLGALADNSTRWTRQTASGAVTTVEPVWRDWLADLDAQARWRRVADARQQASADAEKQGTLTLRLDLDGRPGALIRLDGTTARVEILGADGAQWQATIAPAAAERLRAALARLPP